MQFTQEEAVVDEVNNGFVYLSTNNSACKSCSSQSGCSSFSFFSNSPGRSLKVLNTLSLEKGDRVMVELKTEKLILGTLLVYILPLVSLLFFSAMGKLFLSEGYSILFGCAGFVLSLFLVKRLLSNKALAHQFEPKLLNKIILINPSSS
ncbi:SoxR reducing system RseC family protein [Cocleimonas sp. KMM 6892]|uniref:SoxR reducing system RseC family protein n=1 Tax=unclassified Cocleimonas TaxID=2639732 RepID=UPI002DBF16B1|nr:MULTISPECIES: SoxR reducing system RseC family protein [unclassified Cocleimonas]MEB8433905.1 SoxR reducing system RseC family protein [Cocleimonas sp. KMM 6892]MEC4716716.1 SoxR reducing system RseC family protein [Cocleimonas sp. KMM 6895]MEC4746129.1 SoxR reducing system RseC family protein [Cocleimonas sp. KMM 6896]